MTTLTGFKHAYLEVKERLQERIWGGNFSVGDKLPTISELAQDYSVSRHTVIKAVRELVNEGTLLSRRSIGITIRSLPRRNNIKFKSILCINKRGVAFPEPISEAIMQFLPDWHWLQTNLSENLSENFSSKFMDEFILNHQYSAYVLHSSDQKVKEYFQDKGLPCIVAGGLEEGLNLPNVCIDQYARFYQAAKYLLNHGYPRIALMRCEQKPPGDYEALAGVIEACTEDRSWERIGKPEVLEINEWDKAGGEREIADFLAKTKFPVGVLSISDTFSCWLLQMATRKGISIPNQLGIITGGHTELPIHTCPETTSIKSDNARLALALGKMLLQVMPGYPLEERHVMIPFEPPYIIERQTTK